MTKEVAEARRSAADFRNIPTWYCLCACILLFCSMYMSLNGKPIWLFGAAFSFVGAWFEQKILQDQAECEILMARFKQEEAAYLDQFQKHEGKE